MLTGSSSAGSYPLRAVLAPLTALCALAGILGAQQPLFTIVQTSDSQAGNETEWQGFEQVLQTIARGGQTGALLPRRVDLVLFPGDIVLNNTSAEWVRARGLLDTWLTANDIPFLAAPGNHDQGSSTSLYEQYIASSDVWEAGSSSFTGHNGRSRSTGWAGLRFIGFNNSNGAWNRVSDADLALIGSRVSAAASANENIFLVAHHPHDGQDRIPLASILTEPSIVGYVHGHSGDPEASRGLTGVSNPNVWDLNTNSIVDDRDLIYYEVFESELRAYVIVLETNPTQLPAAQVIRLVHPLSTGVAVDRGFEDASHAGARAWPSGSAPEKKLWFQGNAWWGVIWHEPSLSYRIQRLDTATQAWIATGTTVSTTPGRSFDALADGTKLYLASHFYSVPSAIANGQPGQVLRYSFDGTTQTYALDAGFPVTINGARTESLVVAQDSVGTLWTTWTENGEVRVNRTLNGNDTTWNGPAPLPFTQATGLDPQDVSALVTFDGKLGLAWTNKLAGRIHFAVREDTTSPTTWLLETAVDQAGAVADSLDLTRFSGVVFLATETPTGVLRLAARSIASPGLGTWGVREIADAAADLTQPIVLIDQTSALVRVFATGPTLEGGSSLGAGAVYEKDAPLSTLTFPAGRGTAVIQDGSNPATGSPSSTRQLLSSTTGLAVVASNELSQRTWHTYSTIIAPPQLPVANFSGTPRAGEAPLLVRFTDLSTGSPTSWRWTFGDGTSSTAASPDHVYNQGGTYSVSLTVTNGAGSNTLTRTGYVVVTEPIPSLVLTALEDTWANQGSKSTNYGADTTLRLRGTGKGANRSFLKFDLSGVSGPVWRARLRLFVTDPTDNSGSVYKVGTSWTESGLTWDNMPALPSSAVASVGSVSSGTWKEVDVTSALAGTTLLGLAIAGGSGNAAYFSSSEGANPPQLAIYDSRTPTANFSGTPLTGTVPLEVQFTDTSGGGPTAWLWNFGDGTTSTQRHPLHVYDETGSYGVTLTASNSSGSNTLTRSAYVSVTAQGPGQVFRPIADARVYESNPNTNYGTDVALRMKTQAGTTYQSYLKFDLASLSGTPTSARLRLYVTDDSNSGGSVYLVPNTWTETAITWANRPALPVTSLATAGAAPLGTWVEFDVSSAVLGPGIVSFALAGGTTNSVIYSSREVATTPPELVVTTQSP